MNFSSYVFSYHAMHRLLLIIMIALLPLRGWAGDAMATGMATGQMQVAAKSIAAHAHAVMEATHFDHENATPDATGTHADCAGHGAEDADHAGDSHCDTCSACQACHTVALPHSESRVPSTFQAFSLPHAAADEFASADAALRQKPPIS